MVKDEIFNARDRLSGALQFAMEEVKQRSPVKKDSVSSPVKSARNSPRQTSRRRKRKILSRELSLSSSYVMKLFNRSVDLAQFQTDTPLYPICRAWMKNTPLNKDMVPRIRTPTPDPPASDEESEKEDTANHLDEEKKPKKEKPVYKMPVFEPLENDVHANNFVSPRIPEPLPIDRDETFDINKFQDEDSPSPAILLGDHMVRWCQVRRSWKDTAQKNELRFNDSVRLLQSMFN